MTKKQIIIFVLLAFFAGAFGSILIGRFVVPYLASFPSLTMLSRLQTNAPIVINRKEEVYLNDGANLIDLAKQAANYTLNLYAGVAPSYKFVGNGIIVTSDGLIVSNKEVIGTQTELIAILNDGRNFKALVRATDPKSELAVLSIDAKDLSMAQFANAWDLQAGQRVIAIGKGGREFMRQFTNGFISRSVASNSYMSKSYNSEIFEENFESSAVLSADFSGGPILNLQGKVVGMSANGSGKILIAENLESGLDSYLNSKKITRPSLGIKYFALSDSAAKLLGFDWGGALVSDVFAGSPAKKSGILINDLIEKIDGQQVKVTSLELILNKHEIGDMKVSIKRGRQQLELTVRLEEK